MDGVSRTGLAGDVSGTRLAVMWGRLAIFASLVLANFATRRLFLFVAPVFALIAAQGLRRRFPLLTSDRLPHDVSLVGSHRAGKVTGNPFLGETRLRPGD
jgi:hypothetical protein